ncbi:MAG: hypothetical protein HW394_1281 [Acidobacteria bacterium]|nr:hypothetical protein [Acidobacteriota bacterium]
MRYDAFVAHTVLRFLLAVLGAGSAVAGVVADFEPTLDRRLIDAAVAIGSSRVEAVRTRYHQPYRIQVARPPIDYIDIVTPFRRIALLAEERARAGGRLFGQREAIAALEDRSDVVEVLIEMTFHPLNVFIGVPAYDVELASASSVTRINPLQISRIPRFGARVDGGPLSSPGASTLPGSSQPLLGGTIVAGFGANALNPNGVYDVVVSEKGKALARARVNVGSLR